MGAARVIDEVDGRLKAWVETVLGQAPVTFAPPADARPEAGISLYLIELLAAPAGRAETHRTHELSLRYLVTAWADEPAEAHRLLGTLVFAAMEDAELEVEIEPLPAPQWLALGATPRPSFFLRAPLRRARRQPRVAPVRKRLRIDLVASSPLRGLVLGPDDAPLPGARVDIPRLHLACYTESDGRFHFPRVPSEPAVKDLRVSVKGARMDVTVEHPADDDLVVIHFDAFDREEG